MPASRRPRRRLTSVAFALLISALGLAISTPAPAGTNADARILIHLLNTTTNDACTRALIVGAAALTCSITGPTQVGSGERYLAYEVTSPDPITSVEWTITGDGLITAGEHTTPVQVWAGSVGAFQLTATVRTGPTNLLSVCSLTVTVLAWGNNCSIEGPTYVAVQDQAVTYTVIPPAGQLTGVTWSIRDFGTIISDPHANPVIVRPDSAGGYTLTAIIETDASPLRSLCYVEVTVIDTEVLSCHIEGPESVTEGIPQINYFVHTTGNVTALEWAISGDAILTSGGTGHGARVQVGDPGAFQLTVTLHGPAGAVESCSKTVTVNPIACAIAGSGSVVAGATGLVYTTGVALVGATYAWQIAGDGTLVGDANGAGVVVNAGAAGAFDLSVTITRNGTPHACARTVTVLYGGGLHSQSNAKILVHLAPTTTGDACGARGAPNCGEISTVGRLAPTSYFAYLLVVDGNSAAGMAGLDCGIEYDATSQSGVDILNWSLCAPSEWPSSGPFGPWPASGSGNRIRWDAATQCQRTVPTGNNASDGVVATAGYFYCAAYSSDRLAVVPRPGSGQAMVMDCGGSASVIGGIGHPAGNLPQLGFAGFSADGSVAGYNPCGVAAVLVRPTTWGSIKAMYGTPPAKGTTP